MSIIDRYITLPEIKSILSGYSVITLEEMEQSHLMSRFDEKFVFNVSKLPAFLEGLKSHYQILSVNSHVLSQYENIYFDTEDLKSYHDHHNGRGTRYKVRFRMYTDSGACYLEVKKKDNRGFTKKNRMPVKEMSRHLSPEDLEFISRYAGDTDQPLQPSLSNHFHRITLVNSECRERVTLDVMIHFQNEIREKDLASVVIAEVKQEHHSYPSAFKRLMQHDRIFPASFSKYCMGTLLTHPGIKYNRFKPKLTILNKICDGLV